MRPTCTILLTLLAMLAFWFDSLRMHTVTVELKSDLSGVGTCNGTQIYVQEANLWTQYPARPNTRRVYTVSPSFQGKNAIVWGANGNVQDFVITNVNNMTVTTDTTLLVNGTCHFTLDGVKSADSSLLWPKIFDAVIKLCQCRDNNECSDAVETFCDKVQGPSPPSPLPS